MKRLMRHLKNKTGSAELMMVLGMAVVGLIVMSSNLSMFQDLNKKNRLDRETLGAKDLQEEIEVLLSLRANCDRNFIGDPINNNPMTDALLNSASNSMFAVGSTTPYMNGLFTIKSWRLRDEPVPVPIGLNKKIVNLDIVMEKVATDSTTGPRELLRTVKLVATVDATGTQIQDCYALKGTASDLWIMAVDPSEIFNTTFGGSIGIGVPSDHTYSNTLEVIGDGRISNDLRAGGINATRDAVTNIGGDINVTGSASFAGNLAIGKATPAARLDVVGDANVTGSTTVTGTTQVNAMSTAGNVIVPGTMTVGGLSTLSNSLNTSGKVDLIGTGVFSGVATFQAPLSIAQLTVGSTNSSSDSLQVVGSAEVTTSIESARLESARLCINGNCRTTFAQQSCPSGLIIRQNVDGTVDCIQPTCSAVASYFYGIDTGPRCSVIPTAACPVNQYIHAINPFTGVVSCRTIPPEVQVPPSCPAGQVMIGVSGGVAQCARPQVPGGSCVGTEVLAGVTIDGRPICREPLSAQSCSPGQIVIGINSSGNPICSSFVGGDCGPSQIVTGINANGSPMCGAFTVVPRTCSTGEVVTGLSSSGIVSCGPVSAASACSSVPNTSTSGAGGAASPAGCYCIVATEVFDGSQCVPNCTFPGTSANGAGGPAYPSGCECTTAGYTWNSGTNTCNPPPTPPPGPNCTVPNTSTAGAGGAATPAGCYCVASNQVYSGGACGVPVNGACGTASGSTGSSAPSSNLCSAGDATAVSGAGPWTWGCNGRFTGTSTASNACTAYVCPAGTSTSGAGGAASPANCRCNTLNYTWDSGTNTCVAPPPSCVADGGVSPNYTAGPMANGTSCTSVWPPGNQPSTGCCSGVAHNAATWETYGTNGCPMTCGSSSNSCYDNCYLGISQNCVNSGTSGVSGLSCNPSDVQNFCENQCGIVHGTCGSAHGSTTASAPSSNLCATGSATPVNGSGPWTWGCNGSGGGSSTAGNACSASPSAPTGDCYFSGDGHGTFWMAAGDDYNGTGCVTSGGCTCIPNSGFECTEQQMGSPVTDIYFRCRVSGPTPTPTPTPATCPTGASSTGAGVTIGASHPGCRCNNAEDVWNGTSCQPYIQSCHYSFNTNTLVSSICTNGDPPDADGGTCTAASGRYLDNSMPTKSCTVQSGDTYTVYACNPCGPGSNIPAGNCTNNPSCSGGPPSPPPGACSGGARAICKPRSPGLVARTYESCDPSAFGNYESLAADCNKASAPTPGSGFDEHCMTCPAGPPPSTPTPTPTPTPSGSWELYGSAQSGIDPPGNCNSCPNSSSSCSGYLWGSGIQPSPPSCGPGNYGEVVMYYQCSHGGNSAWYEQEVQCTAP